jgi:hypothetical protein
MINKNLVNNTVELYCKKYDGEMFVDENMSVTEAHLPDISTEKVITFLANILQIDNEQVGTVEHLPHEEVRKLRPHTLMSIGSDMKRPAYVFVNN